MLTHACARPLPKKPSFQEMIALFSFPSRQPDNAIVLHPPPLHLSACKSGYCSVSILYTPRTTARPTSSPSWQTVLGRRGSSILDPLPSTLPATHLNFPPSSLLPPPSPRSRGGEGTRRRRGGGGGKGYTRKKERPQSGGGTT